MPRLRTSLNFGELLLTYQKKISKIRRTYIKIIHNKMKKSVIFVLFLNIICISCGHQAIVKDVDYQKKDYWQQEVHGDSLKVFPMNLDYIGIYALGMDYSPLKSLTFLSKTTINDYWKKKHLLLFKDNENQLVFEEYVTSKKVYSYPLIYASIKDSRIFLYKDIHVGLKRADVLRRLKLKNVDDNIQTVCLTSGWDASTTFYFANDFLAKIIIRTDKELLHNPDPVFECRHAGQVRGYTGKRLYAVVKEPFHSFSSVCYVNEQGDTVVPYGRYNYCVSDSIAPVGFVLEKGVNGITCINTEGQVMCYAFVVDNLTPDYLSEGYFRIVNEEGLIGFADSLGNIVVPPQFKFAYPFDKGKAKVTYTGSKSDPNDEHWEWVSDDWFYIDYQGRAVHR